VWRSAHLPGAAVGDGAPADRRGAANRNSAGALRDKCVHVRTVTNHTAIQNFRLREQRNQRAQYRR
jgi:hypothetical protein